MFLESGQFYNFMVKHFLITQRIKIDVKINKLIYYHKQNKTY